MARRVVANHVLAWFFYLHSSGHLLWLLFFGRADDGLRKIRMAPRRRRHGWILLLQHCNQPPLDGYDTSVLFRDLTRCDRCYRLPNIACRKCERQPLKALIQHGSDSCGIWNPLHFDDFLHSNRIRHRNVSSWSGSFKVACGCGYECIRCNCMSSSIISGYP